MRILFFFFLSLSTFMAQAQTPQSVNAYIDRYKAIAIEEMKMYGIPASVTLAQGIHESGCGCSALALNSNNHFGIKCHEDWCGQTYHHDDDQPQECFRVYTRPEESFRDHSEFLKTRPRYATLFSIEHGDYRAWAKGLKAAGYATNPKYPEIIIKLIEDYNLSQYDKPGSGSTVTVAKTNDKINSEVQLIKQSLLQSTTMGTGIGTAADIKKETPVNKNIDIAKSTSDERIINSTKAVLYKKDIPIAFVAQKYNITVQQLYAFNDMSPIDKFKENELIYVESKKPESSYYQYEVAEGETMRDISQKFAIQLSELVKRNGIMSGCEPAGGEIIVLRGKREFPLKFKVTGKANLTKASAEITMPSDTRIHTVGSSETLYSISKQYNIPLDTLKKINGLRDEDNIRIGQTLVVNL
jgi:LysM repeat protein